MFLYKGTALEVPTGTGRSSVGEMSRDIQIDFISYSGERPRESHPHAQILLATEGGMEIEIAGRAEKLSEGLGAFVPPGALHSQLAERRNNFLLLNYAQTAFHDIAARSLAHRVFFPISPPVRQLINYAVEARQSGLPLAPLAEHWTQLLFCSVAPPAPAVTDYRLAKLAGLVESSLDASWTVEEMARHACLSPSRLHALFQEKMNTTPQDWLTELKMKHVQKWLAATDLSIADLAQRVGYADQSALTRAMRRITGLTPGAYRKQQQELWSKSQK